MCVVKIIVQLVLGELNQRKEMEQQLQGKQGRGMIIVVGGCVCMHVCVCTVLGRHEHNWESEKKM